jgi:hypothetical protein
MTAPISLTAPEQSDRDRTSTLVTALEPHGCFEGEQEMTHRMEVSLVDNISKCNFVLQIFNKKLRVRFLP